MTLLAIIFWTIFAACIVMWAIILYDKMKEWEEDQ